MSPPTEVDKITDRLQKLEGLSVYSNNSNHPIIRTPEKCLIFVFQAFEHPCLKLLSQYPNTYIATPRGAQTGVAECLLAFDSLCGTRARVTERLLAYYRRFQTCTRLLLSLPHACYIYTLIVGTKFSKRTHNH